MVLKTKSASSKVKGKAAPSVELAAKIKSTGTKKATVVKGAPVEGAAKENASSSSGKAPAKKAATSPAKGQKKNAPVKVSPVPQATAEPKKDRKESGKDTQDGEVSPSPAKSPTTKHGVKPPTSKPNNPAEDSAINLAKESERRKKVKATLAKLRSEPDWKQFLAEQKKALIQMRDELLPNMHNVTRDHLRSGESNVSSSSGQHIGDAGSEAEQRDITILRLDKDREQLFEIEAALDRIAKGTYGVCELSLEPIPRKRLQARPFCRFTVKCQEEYEKRYGAFSALRSKNSGDVGFSGLQKVIESTILLDDDEE